MSHKLSWPTERADLPKLPTTYLDFLNSLLRAHPVFAQMIGDGATYVPNDVQTSHPPRDCSSLGRYFFPSASPRETWKFTRTATALIAARGFIEHDEALYRLITWSQEPADRLAKTTFEELCYSLSAFEEDPAFYGALKLYLILRGYARTPQARARLYAYTGLEFGPNSGITVLGQLVQHHLIPDEKHLMTNQRNYILHAIAADFPLLSSLSGEVPVSAADEYALNRNTKSGLLAIAANLCELCASASHIKCHGLSFLRESLAEDCLTTLRISGNPIENVFRMSTSTYLGKAYDSEVIVAAERLSRMFSADSSFTPQLISYLTREKNTYSTLIDELSIDFVPSRRGANRNSALPHPPIFLFLGHSYLCGIYNLNVTKGVPDPLIATLDEALPCLTKRLATLRAAVPEAVDEPIHLVLNLAPDSHAAHRNLMRQMATVRAAIKEDQPV